MNNTNVEKLLNEKLILRKAELHEKMVVADMGCGSVGHYTFPVAKIVGKEGRVYAVDILKKSLEGIKRKAHTENIHNVIPVWSNLEIFKATDIPVGSLDLVIMINTLNQSKHHAAIIRELVRLLKKNAKVLVVEWKKIAIPFGPKIENRVDEQNLVKVAQKLGLHLEEEFNAGDYHYGLIFNKL